MARNIRDATLDSRAARAKLKPNGNPYYRALDRGLHLGYRKGTKTGVWVVRRIVGDKKYVAETLGAADDMQDADGITILTFYQAQDRARGHAAAVVEQDRVAALGAPVTVKDAIEEYLISREKREREQRGVDAGLKRDPRSRLTKHVLADAELAGADLQVLSEDMLSTWRADLAGDLADGSVRRTVNDFKAALNGAAKRYRNRLPPSLAVVIKNGLASVDATAPVAREAQVLPDADVRSIIAAAWQVDEAGGWCGDLARLVLVLAATGARFSQVVRLTVADVQKAQSRIMVPVSLKGRGQKAAARTGVRVGADVLEALRPALAGRKGPDPLLLRPRWRQTAPMKWEMVSRAPWQSSAELTRPWAAIVNQAELPADVVPYALRHSSIVRALGAGLPIRLVAAIHDTSSVMIEKHYSAFIVDAMDELAARAVVPMMSADVVPLVARGVGGNG